MAMFDDNYHSQTGSSVKYAVAQILLAEDGVLPYLGAKLLTWEQNATNALFPVSADFEALRSHLKIESRIASAANRRHLIFAMTVSLYNINICDTLSLILGDAKTLFGYEERFITYFLQAAELDTSELRLQLHFVFDASPEPVDSSFQPEVHLKECSMYLDKPSSGRGQLPERYQFSRSQEWHELAIIRDWNFWDKTLPISRELTFNFEYQGDWRRSRYYRKPLIFTRPSGRRDVEDCSVGLFFLDHSYYIGAKMDKQIRDLTMNSFAVTKDELLVIEMAGLKDILFLDKPYDLRDTGLRLLNF